MKTITAIIGIITVIFLVGAVSAMYAGESETFDFGSEIANCSIINNTYNLTGLNLTWNNTNATISTVTGYKPDNFSVSCWVITGEEEIVEQYYSSGGGSGSYISWQCGEWEECVEGISARICYKTISPLTTKEETKSCTQEFLDLNYQGNDSGGNQNELEEPEKELQGKTTTNFLTGAVTGVNNFVKSGFSLVIGAIILIAGIIVIFITRKKKPNFYY